MDKENLMQSGKKYHSRHGEWFYLERLRQGDLFPSKELLETPNFVIQEAKALGWDISIPLHEWSEEGKACYLLSHASQKPLKEVTAILAKNGLEGVWDEIARANFMQRERDMLLILSGDFI